MSPARQLYELQQVELRIQEYRQALHSLAQRLADRHEVEEAQQHLTEARGRLDRMRREQRDLELQLEGLEARIRDLDARLYSGRTTNPKELLGMQEELRLLRGQKQAQEDRLLEVLVQVEEAQAALQEAQERLRHVQEQWEVEHQRLLEEQARLEQELVSLEGQHQHLIARIAPEELHLYQRLRASHRVVVARVEGGICRGCGLTLPSHQLQRARTARELVQCTSCGRILYVS